MTAGTIDGGPSDGGAVARPADTRSRLLDTAINLFSQHGFEGTSLQMIADELGVTKAAVYYHFKTKAEIAEAVAADAIEQFEAIVDAAQAERRRSAQIETALDGVIGLVVKHRAVLAMFSSDQGLLHVLQAKKRVRSDLKDRFVELFVGPEASDRETVSVHVLMAGLMMAGGLPELAGYDDDELHVHLREFGLRALGRPRRRG